MNEGVPHADQGEHQNDQHVDEAHADALAAEHDDQQNRPGARGWSAGSRDQVDRQAHGVKSAEGRVRREDGLRVVQAGGLQVLADGQAGPSASRWTPSVLDTSSSRWAHGLHLVFEVGTLGDLLRSLPIVFSASVGRRRGCGL